MVQPPVQHTNAWHKIVPNLIPGSDKTVDSKMFFTLQQSLTKFQGLALALRLLYTDPLMKPSFFKQHILEVN